MKRQTLGEDRTGTCAICATPFDKARHDQKFCSIPCRTEAKQFYARTRWFDRADREVQNEKRKERYYENRPEILAREKQWRQENPDLARAKAKKSYEKNKRKHIARTQAFRKAHPEVRQREYANARKKRPWQGPLFAARHRASKKGFSFDLTREWCEQNWTGQCVLTGLPFMFGTTRAYPFAPSIDRIDSSLGYLKTNCRFVLFAINSFKGVGTDEAMLIIANALISHQKAAPAKL